MCSGDLNFLPAPWSWSRSLISAFLSSAVLQRWTCMVLGLWERGLGGAFSGIRGHEWRECLKPLEGVSWCPGARPASLSEGKRVKGAAVPGCPWGGAWHNLGQITSLCLNFLIGGGGGLIRCPTYSRVAGRDNLTSQCFLRGKGELVFIQSEQYVFVT